MQFTKHIHVLQLLSTVPAPIYNQRVMTDEDAIAAWDHVYTYIHEHWAKPMSAEVSGYTTIVPQADVVDCRDMLDMKHDELVAKLESLPPYFREEIFPVAVARYLLRDLRIPLMHRYSTTFLEFHNRYGRIVLAT